MDPSSMWLVVRRPEGKTLRDHPWILFLDDTRAEPWPMVDRAALLLSLSDLFDPCHSPNAVLNASILSEPDRSTTNSGCRPACAESVSLRPRPVRRRHDRHGPRHAGLPADQPARRLKERSEERRV